LGEAGINSADGRWICPIFQACFADFPSVTDPGIATDGNDLAVGVMGLGDGFQVVGTDLCGVTTQQYTEADEDEWEHGRLFGGRHHFGIWLKLDQS
jgi:hypothetical protein